MSPLFTGSKFCFGSGGGGPSLISATGGTVTTAVVSGVNYRLHTFTTVGNSTFTITGGEGQIDVFIVGGMLGGGGGGGGTAINSGANGVSATNNGNGGAGGTNTGGGGGAGSNGSGSQSITGGKGGSGIVMIRYIY